MILQIAKAKPIVIKMKQGQANYLTTPTIDFQRAAKGPGVFFSRKADFSCLDCIIFVIQFVIQFVLISLNLICDFFSHSISLQLFLLIASTIVKHFVVISSNLICDTFLKVYIQLQLQLFLLIASTIVKHSQIWKTY